MEPSCQFNGQLNACTWCTHVHPSNFMSHGPKCPKQKLLRPLLLGFMYEFNQMSPIQAAKMRLHSQVVMVAGLDWELGH